MENKKNKSIDNELSDASPNIISLTNSQAQVIYDQKGLDYISNLPFINKRDTGGNVVITGTVLPLTDEEQAKYNESITIELNDRVYTNSSVNRALDTQFKYFKFPAKLTTRVVPTGSIDLPELQEEGGLLFTGRILNVEGKLYYLEGSTYYEIAADSPQLGFPQKHLPALTFLSEKLEKPFLFRVKDDDPDSELFPRWNNTTRNGYADANNLTYNNQKGELRRRDKYSGIIDIKSETYLSDPKFEDGGILGLADLADNNITDTVVEFNFDLIDEINPAPYEFGLLVDDVGAAFINQKNIIANSPLRAGMQRRSLDFLTLNTGVNRIGIWAVNTGGPGNVNYEFKDRLDRPFRHAKGWRAQDAFADQYDGDPSGFKPWQNTPVDEEMTPSRIVTNAYAEDGSYNKVYNTEGKFWLGNNNFGSGFSRINAEYKWDNRGVRSAAVYRLGLNQDIGWSPKSNTNKRYGVVMVNSPLTIAVETDNFILPNLEQVEIVVTLKYKSTPTKEIRNRIPSKSWNGFNQITVSVPAADVTEDLYQINVEQDDVPIVDEELVTLRDDQRNKKSLLDHAEIIVREATNLRDSILEDAPRGSFGQLSSQSLSDLEFANSVLNDAQDIRNTAQTDYDDAVAASSRYLKNLAQGNS